MWTSVRSNQASAALGRVLTRMATSAVSARMDTSCCLMDTPAWVSAVIAFVFCHGTDIYHVLFSICHGIDTCHALFSVCYGIDLCHALFSVCHGIDTCHTLFLVFPPSLVWIDCLGQVLCSWEAVKIQLLKTKSVWMECTDVWMRIRQWRKESNTIVVNVGWRAVFYLLILDTFSLSGKLEATATNFSTSWKLSRFNFCSHCCLSVSYLLLGIGVLKVCTCFVWCN